MPGFAPPDPPPTPVKKIAPRRRSKPRRYRIWR
jgi:hypothetical protein